MMSEELSLEEILQALERCKKCKHYGKTMLEDPCCLCEQTGSHFEKEEE